MITLAAYAMGFLLDLWLGDPHSSPFRHPVVTIGGAIAHFEKWLRRRFPASPRGELFAGALLALLIPGATFALVFFVLFLLQRIHPALRLILESFWCYQILAVKSLKDESMAVYQALKQNDIKEARHAVSMIVGRDTASLDTRGVAKAAVETVAENNSDGAVAPLFFMALGGAPLGMLYKAINTLDSMVGYKNEKYRHFGTFSARLDDIANYIPSRLAALFIVAAAFLSGLDGKGAWRIFRRDRRNHLSPNSAQTEAACAGALGVQLGGAAPYGGKMVEKPTIGDALRPIEAEDIRRANRLHYVASALAFVVFGALRAVIFFVFPS